MAIAVVASDYHIGSASGAWVPFLLFGGGGVILGWMITRELARREQPHAFTMLGTTKVARRVIGTVFAMLFVAPLWMELWSGYYVVEVDSKSVVLRYLTPPRQSEVPLADVAAIRWVASARSRRLEVETRQGRHLRSAKASASAAQMDSLVNLVRQDLVRQLAK